MNSVLWQVYNHIRSYLIGSFISWAVYFKTFFYASDYVISKIRVFYTIDPKKVPEELDPHWLTIIDDSVTTDEYTTYALVSASKFNTLASTLKDVPSFVKDVNVQITFWFRGEKRNYIITDINKLSVWPPQSCINRHSKFTVPIKRARLVTLNESEDVTSRIKKFSGPFGDFYGDKIIPKLFFLTWEPKDLQQYDYLEIIDILGLKKEYAID